MAKVVDGKVILGSAQEWPDGLTWEAVIRWVEAGKGRFPRANVNEPVQPALPWSVCKQLMGLDRDREHGTYSATASEIAAIVTPLGFTFPGSGRVTIDEGWFMALVISEYMQSPVKDNLTGSCSTDTEPVICQGPWVQRVLDHLAECIA